MESLLCIEPVFDPAPRAVKKRKEREKKFHPLGNIHHSIFCFKMFSPSLIIPVSVMDKTPVESQERSGWVLRKPYALAFGFKNTQPLPQRVKVCSVSGFALLSYGEEPCPLRLQTVLSKLIIPLEDRADLGKCFFNQPLKSSSKGSEYLKSTVS